MPNLLKMNFEGCFFFYAFTCVSVGDLKVNLVKKKS